MASELILDEQGESNGARGSNRLVPQVVNRGSRDHNWLGMARFGGSNPGCRNVTTGLAEPGRQGRDR